ncbi:MAG: radical SAM family heme chaperone HemW [Actinomycetes bacterium]
MGGGSGHGPRNYRPGAAQPHSDSAQTLAIDRRLAALGARAERVPATPLGLYVHVPYCARRCGYCAFTTYVVSDPVEAAAAQVQFTDGAVAELSTAATVLRGAPALTSVFVGGGTPSLLDPELLVRLLDAVRDQFDVADDLEMTVEANPGGLADGGSADETFGTWAAAGVTRVSFGLQSAVPRVLELLDRTHSPDAAARAVAAATAAGVPHTSVDLIYGTPGESADDWATSLGAALDTGADHVSAYALGVEPGTKLAARVRGGSLTAPSDDEAAERYVQADALLRAAGFAWYEVSNWSRTPAAQSRHNHLYWHNHHWWGVGPGAHSHVAGVRWSNARDPGAWADAAQDGRDHVEELEVLDGAAQELERMLLGVRLAEGLPVDGLARHAVDRVVDDGLATADGDRLVLTLTGRLLADTVVRALVGPEGPGYRSAASSS